MQAEKQKLTTHDGLRSVSKLLHGGSPGCLFDRKLILVASWVKHLRSAILKPSPRGFTQVSQYIHFVAF